MSSTQKTETEQGSKDTANETRSGKPNEPAPEGQVSPVLKAEKEAAQSIEANGPVMMSSYF